MSSRKSKRDPDNLFCSEFGPEDGIDPRHLSQGGSNRKSGRKAMQLCKQVEQTLNGALLESPDEILQNLCVVSVVPAPNALRLLVTVTTAVSADDLSADVILERLLHNSGRLRSEVAAAIHRKKTPELTFRIV